MRRAAGLLVALALGAALGSCGGDRGGRPKVALGRGGQLFVDRCGRCHTLDAAGTDGKVGPMLDTLRPSAGTVLTAIDNGPGVMPSRLVDGADGQAVARFVADCRLRPAPAGPRRPRAASAAARRRPAPGAARPA